MTEKEKPAITTEERDTICAILGVKCPYQHQLDNGIGPLRSHVRSHAPAALLEDERGANMEITYLYQPPRRYTFEAPKLKEWIEQHCQGKVLNLFAGTTKLNVEEFRVDIDPNTPANYHGDAFEFIMNTEMRFDTVILDPPWSLRKSREKYGGRVVGSFTKIKDNLKRVLNEGGRVITVGYSSTGMSKSRGFTKIALCIICHNGDHDDAYAVEEEYEKDMEIVVENEQARALLNKLQLPAKGERMKP